MALIIPKKFFLNKELHKNIRVIKSENILVAWNYPEEKRMWYDHALVKREFQNAYKLSEVAGLIGRRASVLIDWIERRLIQHPSGQEYNINNRTPKSQYWSEDDVLDLRDQIFNLTPKNKYGEPYKSFDLISRSELVAKMRGNESYYVRAEDGAYVQIWKAL